MTNTIRNKATFRAMREQLGYTKTEFAELLGVHKNSVWRWESEDFDNQPPEDVWNLLDNAIDRQNETVEKTMDAIKQYEKENGAPPSLVRLAYYRTQKEYDRYGRDEADVRTINATTRLLGMSLRRAGYAIRYDYPSDQSETRPATVE